MNGTWDATHLREFEQLAALSLNYLLASCFNLLVAIGRECGNEPRDSGRKEPTSGLVFLGAIPFFIPCVSSHRSQVHVG